MDTVKQLKSLLQEAELYRSQGLLNEAKTKYLNASKLIKNDKQLKTRQNLIDSITKKIRNLDNSIDKIEKTMGKLELSSTVQDLIINKFSFSVGKDEDTDALDGAIALAKFGQYERALTEFNKLITKEQLQLAAAKNIIKCRIAFTSIDDAVNQYQQWFDNNIFTPDKLEKIRVFLQEILDKHGIDKSLPQAKEAVEDKGAEKAVKGQLQEDEVLDVISIGIVMDSGPKKGELVEFDVSFQSGNVISLLIPGKEKELIENFKVGAILNGIQFYSSMAMFNASGVIASLAEIKVGPRKGDYNLDIKIKRS
jgi:tetratricopeptide (TPR) repeat protein